MTKATYFEMCEAMGSMPVDEEIPVEYDDLPYEVQNAIGVYSKLRDEWDTMNGIYMGKSYNGILDILTILEVPDEDKRTMFDLIELIDKHRSESLKKEKDQKTKNPAK